MGASKLITLTATTAAGRFAVNIGIKVVLFDVTLRKPCAVILK
jgi:hypothetical protein